LNNDYINQSDGLLYCGNCNTPKQKRNELLTFLNDTTFPINCKCQSEQLQFDIEQRKIIEKVNHIRNLRKTGIPDKRLQSYTFENDDGSCSNISKARTYIDNWNEMYETNTGLILWGDVGVGKTYFASCIVNALIDNEVSCMMINFAHILNKLGRLYPDERIEYIREFDKYKLLVIDDFGMERDTAYVMEQLYLVINSRYLSRQPLIVTTNLTLNELMNPTDMLHSRIYSRVTEMCMPIWFGGEDIRLKKAKDKFIEAKKLFTV